MKKKGLFSRDFIVQAAGLFISIVVVFSVYKYYIWPVSEDIEITNSIQASQNPDGVFIPKKSVTAVSYTHLPSPRD